MTRRTPARPAAFTMIETMLSMLLTSTVLLAALAALQVSMRMQSVSTRGTHGILLAQELLAEIAQLDYEDADTPGVIGPESGEGIADRSDLDDLDDYDGLVDDPPADADGVAIDGADAYVRTVTVVWMNTDLVTVSGVETGLKRIHIRITNDGDLVATLTALRSGSYVSAVDVWRASF